MLRILVKKQLSELFRNYFYNAKKNKAYSKGGTIFLFVLFGLLLTGIGGMFAFTAVSLAKPLADVQSDWLFFGVIGAVSIAFGVFGSIFNTFASLYLPKDNDFLLSMPIPSGVIIASRLLVVYIMGLMYSGLVSLPATIVYWITVSFSVKTLFGGLLFILLLSIFVFTLSCLLGWVVAKISVKAKRKNALITIMSLVFIGGVYALSYYSQTLMSNLIANASEYGALIKQKAYFLYFMSDIGTGNYISILIDLAIVTVSAGLTVFLISRSFLKIATSSEIRSENKKTKIKQQKQKGVSGALLQKEFLRFFGSPNYMINCSLGVLGLIVVGVVLLIKGRALAQSLNALFDGLSSVPRVVVCVIACGLLSLNIPVVPSVSLEGKNIWIAQSLPINVDKILFAKICLQLIIGVVPLAIFTIMLAFSGIFDVLSLFVTVLFALAFLTLYTLFGLFMGLKMPIMNWTNELTPIKQNLSVLIVTLLGIVYSVLPALYLVTDIGAIGFEAFIGILTSITVVLCIPLAFWIKNKGSKIFQTL